jgi:hypothetical protein
MLDAKRVILAVGPFWWPAAGPAGLTWLVGWHPNGARYRGFPADTYANMIIATVAEIEAGIQPTESNQP